MRTYDLPRLYWIQDPTCLPPLTGFCPFLIRKVGREDV